MHDIKAIRQNPLGFDAQLARRGLPPMSEHILEIDRDRRADITAQQIITGTKKMLSDEYAQTKDHDVLNRLHDINDALGQLGRILPDRIAKLNAVLSNLPNTLDADVPDHENACLSLDSADFPYAGPYKRHFELGVDLGMMYFESAAKMAGSRFTILSGPLARLERALGQFMMDTHISKHGYQEVAVPALVTDLTMYGTGQLPKFADDLFRTTDGRYLIPTAEVPLTNMYADQIIPCDRLPIRLTALTDCFRAEAGSAGRDVRGMMRQHQFKKVELVSIVHPDDSERELQRIVDCAREILNLLGLPRRDILLCATDVGFSTAKTIDLEVLMAGEEAWREISSCSNCRDFQARRMKTRFRDKDGTVKHVHTLNGSGVAVGRALIAIMENYQQADGSIDVPYPLQRYMGCNVIRNLV